MELDEEGLSGITSPLLGREITASELNAAVEQLNQYARKNYPAAIAYIPEQTAREGKLLIRFEPGRFDKVQIEEGSVLKESVAHRPLAGLRKGGIIEAGSLEESLQNLRDIPGIAANAVLSPGSEQGTSNLTVKISDMHPATYILYAENYGSRAAGRYRYGFQADWKNLGGTGSRLMAGGESYPTASSTAAISPMKSLWAIAPPPWAWPTATRTTSWVAFGADWGWRANPARLDYARRIGMEDGLSRDADSRQRIWFLLGKVF